MKKIIFLLGIFACCGKIVAAPPEDSSFTDIRKITDQQNISSSTLILSSSSDQDVRNINPAAFSKLNAFADKNEIPVPLVNNTFFLSFTLQNKSDSAAEIFYYPANVIQTITLYKKNISGNFEPVPFNREGDFIAILLQPGEKSAFIVKLDFFKLRYNRFQSVLVNKERLGDFRAGINLPYFARNTGLGLLSGMLLLMCLFTVVNFIINKKKEFLFNSVYTACMFMLLFFTAFLTRTAGEPRGYFFSYLDLLLLTSGTWGYLQFIRIFLKELFPEAWLAKFLKFEQITLAVMMVLYTYLHFFTATFAPQEMLENVMKVFTLASGIVYIVVALKFRNRFINYLVIGTALQMIFSALSMFLILKHIPVISIFSSGTFFFGIGVIASVIFYLLGLTYRNRVLLIDRMKERQMLRAEAERKEFEKQLEIITARQHERNRISADIHDDLGAGMTAIRLYSELALAKMGSTKIPEIEKISASANELLNNMNAIIWSMSSSNDSLVNTIAYIRSYAISYFEEGPVKCTIILPENVPVVEVSGGIRRNIFLITKEALHNVVKHSGATAVELKLEITGNDIIYTIRDNGKGTDCNSGNAFRNGMKNMKKRAEDISVSLTIENDNGTLITMKRSLQTPS